MLIIDVDPGGKKCRKRSEKIDKLNFSFKDLILQIIF